MPLRSRVLSVSRLVGRAKCARADYLRHEDELAPYGVLVEAEHLTRGSVIHAGLAAAVLRMPGQPDPAEVAAACAAEAVSRGLGVRDPRLAGWVRVALRAARAMRPEDWRPVRLPLHPATQPVRLPDASVGTGRGEGAPPSADAAARRIGDESPVLVEHRVGVPLPDSPGLGSEGGGWLASIKPDGVLENLRTGRVWQWDHKTKGASSMSRVGPWTELHLQSLVYTYGLRSLGVAVDGAVLYAVLADEPTVPELRKDGNLKDIAYATDRETLLEAIARSADPDPESPRYAKQWRAVNERVWQDSQEVVFDDREVELAWEHVVDARDEYVLQVARAEERARRLRVPVWKAMHPTGRGVACESCDYKAWCTEDFAGRDAEMLLGSTYRRGQDKYVSEVALTSGRADIQYESPGDFNAIERRRSAP